jgi:hypothetical protein
VELVADDRSLGADSVEVDDVDPQQAMMSEVYVTTWWCMVSFLVRPGA